uniref:HTH_Tnp_Tc3_2 domain-containing protein n=1 Tax=Heterorhabditis bacteriophora TaxID=37862 RepID=A0A1I7WSA3_HETBA
MSKGKNITPNQRVMIKALLEQNLSEVQIAKKLELSRCSVQNATKHITKSGILENVPRTRRNRNITKRIDGTIRRQCENNRQLIARDIYDEVKAYPECSLSVRKKPLVSLKNRKARKAWTQISVQRCPNLVDSMPRRCAAVIKNFGYPTKY